MHSPLLTPKEGTLLPTPGGGVGGFDKSELYDDPQYATEQHHAKPGSDDTYNMPFGEKGTEPEGTKHGALLTVPTHQAAKNAARRGNIQWEIFRGGCNSEDIHVTVSRIFGEGFPYGITCFSDKGMTRIHFEAPPSELSKAKELAIALGARSLEEVKRTGKRIPIALTASRNCECHGFTESEKDKSVCTCGHQWHEHWHKGGFGCKLAAAMPVCPVHGIVTPVEGMESHPEERLHSGTPTGWSTVCPQCGRRVTFQAEPSPADMRVHGPGWVMASSPSEPAFRAAQILAQFGRIAEADVRRVAREIDDLVSQMPIFPLSKGRQPKQAVSETPVKVTEDLEDIPSLLRSAAITDAQRFREELKEGAPGLDAYLYRSDVYCPECGQDIIDELVDKHLILPPAPDTDSSWTMDSENVPQPLFFVEQDESCVRCGEDIPEGRGEPVELFSKEDRGFLGEMGISASLTGLTQQVKPTNPLLVPKVPDPETATFLKEGWEDPEYNKGWLKGTQPGVEAFPMVPWAFETEQSMHEELGSGHPCLVGQHDWAPTPMDADSFIREGYPTHICQNCLTPGREKGLDIRKRLQELRAGKGKAAAKKPRCPHCGSGDYGLMPTDFETAKCSKCGGNWHHGIVEGINDPKTATEKSYGTGTPVGGTDSGVPATKADPSQPRWTPPAPPTAPGSLPQQQPMPQQGPGVPQPPPPSSIPQAQIRQQVVNEVTQQNPQADRKMVEQVAESLQDKTGGVLTPGIDPHEAPEFLPPHQRKHLDDTLIDETGAPPIPLHKGAGAAEEEPDEDVTDLGTVYGRPLRRRPDYGETPGPAGRGWKITCPECGVAFRGPTEDGADNAFYKHWTAEHPAKSIPLKGMADAVPEGPEGQEGPEGWSWPGHSRPQGQLSDAASWWAGTPPDARRSMAERLGIDKYWTHFKWTSLPPGVQDTVRIRIQEPSLGLTEEDKGFLGEMGIQAAKGQWDPLLAKQLYEQGKDAFEHGRPDEAVGLLKKSLDSNPYNGPAHFMLGIALAQGGETGGAIYELERALRIRPQDSYAYHSIIKGMEKEGLLESLPREVSELLRDRMVSKEASAKSRLLSLNRTRETLRAELSGEELYLDPEALLARYGQARKRVQAFIARVVSSAPNDEIAANIRDSMSKAEAAYKSGDGRRAYVSMEVALQYAHELIRNEAFLDNVEIFSSDGKMASIAPPEERSGIRRTVDPTFPDVPVSQEAMACPNCKGNDTAPVQDPEGGGSLTECRGCGAFFSG